MNVEKWQSMSDEQKTKFMRNVFKHLDLGETFDYAECRRVYEKMKEHGKEGYGVYNNPCLTLKLVDPIMAGHVLSWMYSKFDIEGNVTLYGETAPIFGYNMTELSFDKHSLMEYNEDEQNILREAVRIINRKVKAFKED